MNRVFNIGTISHIPDPCPMGTLQEAFEALAHRYPAVRHSAVFESDAQPLDAETVAYTIPLIKAKNNG